MVVNQDHVITGHNRRTWNTAWWQQFSVLLKRGLKARSQESFSHLKIVQVLVITCITSLIWWQSSTDNLQDQVSLMFLRSSDQELRFQPILIPLLNRLDYFSSTTDSEDSYLSSKQFRLFHRSEICSKMKDLQECIDYHHTS